MSFDDIRALLAVHREELARLGVISLSVFGSVARGDARPDSDVDLLGDIDPTLGLFEFVAIKLFLEDLLGRKVDLVEASGLQEPMRQQVLQEAVRAA